MSDQSDLNEDNPIGKKSLQSQQGFLLTHFFFILETIFERNSQDLVFIRFIEGD